MQGFPAWQGLRTPSFLPGWGVASAGYKSQCHRRSPRVEISDGHGSDTHALILSSHHHLSHSAARVRLRNSKQTLDCRRPKRQSPCEKHLDGHDSEKKTSHTSYTKLRSCILHQRQGASDPTPPYAASCDKCEQEWESDRGHPGSNLRLLVKLLVNHHCARVTMPVGDT